MNVSETGVRLQSRLFVKNGDVLQLSIELDAGRQLHDFFTGKQRTPSALWREDSFRSDFPTTESVCPISLTNTCRPAFHAARDRDFHAPQQSYVDYFKCRQPARREPDAIRPAVQLVQSLANFTLCNWFFHLSGPQPLFNCLSPIGPHRYLFRLAR